MVSLALIVEDGSQVSGANSYADEDTILEYAAYRGIDLADSPQDQIIAWAILAMDFIESFRDSFKGQKVAATQSLQWPREIPLNRLRMWDTFSDPLASFNYPDPNVQVDNFDILPTEIPPTLVAAQCQLVIEQSKGVQLFVTSNPNATVKLVKIGPITREFFSADNQPLIPAFTALLNTLL